MNTLIENEVFTMDKMKSGRSCLNLNSRVSWESFPEYAESLLGVLGGTIQKKSDSPDIRVWEVRTENQTFRLVFEDFPVMVSLESTSVDGDIHLARIKERLRVA